MRSLRSLLILIATLLALPALAGQGYIRLTTFPTMSVADARSTVTVTAEIRDENGRNVPDGTQVIFNSTLGTFRETAVQTVNGIARSVFVAGGIPGTAKITASALVFNATASVDLELFSDRSLLSSAKEYVEVVSPAYMMFDAETATLAAAGPKRGAKLRYREIQVEADDIQYSASLYEVKAKKAKLRFGKKDPIEFNELYLRLNKRKGYGTTIIKQRVITSARPAGRFFTFETEERERLALVEISPSGVVPVQEGVDSSLFVFEDFSGISTHISAEKAVVFPNKEVQFHKASVYVDGSKILQLPLYQMNLSGPPQIFAEQIININDNQLAVNYPHYLSLKPGESSLLRFRMGENYGRTVGANRGVFIDYELNWNEGDESQGGLTISGINRDDWSIGARHTMQFDSRTNAYMQVELPERKTLFGSFGVSRQFNGFQMSLNGNGSRPIGNDDFISQRLSLVVEKDPTKVGKLPVRLYYGITANQATNIHTIKNDETGVETTFRNYRMGVGLRARAQTLPMRLDSRSTVNASFAVTKLQGHNTREGFILAGSATYNRAISDSTNVLLTYDYLDDGFTDAITGKHRLSLQGNYSEGRTYISVYGGQSLGIDRYNVFADLSYRLSGLWRVSYSYTLDRYLQDSFVDYSTMLSYRLGNREVGLTWSRRSNRFGIQVLGATFN